jgi:phage repressor protein C with HTH and peptisase S24 domain
MDAVRRRLMNAAKAKRLTLAELSRRCHKNHAYFQQFINRGIPAELPEKVRRAAAGVLGIREAELRADDGPERISIDQFETSDHVPAVAAREHNHGRFQEIQVQEIDVRAGMGGGGLLTHEVRQHGDAVDPVKSETWSFPSEFMRQELRVPAARLIVIETQGDSMTPTILPGERVLVDTGHQVPSPDGIYALRDRFGAIVVKRLQSHRRQARITIISDNPHHPAEEVGLDEIAIVGRVIGGWKRY